MSANIIARLRRAASKVMPEDPVRVRMTAHDADFLADSADGYRSIMGHVGRIPNAKDFDHYEDYCFAWDTWADVLKDWSTE